MAKLINRRGFLKNSAAYSGGLLVTNAFATYFPLLQGPGNGIGATDEDDFFETFFLTSNFLTDEILIQAEDFTIGGVYSFPDGGKNTVIFCRKLNVNGLYENRGKNLTVICDELVGLLQSNIIDLSGKKGVDILVPQPKKDKRHSYDGEDGDNLDESGNPFDIHGKNGGNCTIYCRKVVGHIKISTDGGNGGKGEDGEAAKRPPDQNPTPQKNRAGIDGIPPGKNGKGADGGNGGNPGNISLFVQDPPLTKRKRFYNYDSASGVIENSLYPGGPGPFGYGSKVPISGGRGTPGGEITEIRTSRSDREVEHRTGNYRESGKNYDTVQSQPASDGNTGEWGKIATLKISPTYWDHVGRLLPSSFLRLLVLKGENYYLNGSLTEAKNIFDWLVSIKVGLSTFKLPKTLSGTISNYLSEEQGATLMPYYNYADTYLRQLQLGFDFFGNPYNYVSLISTESLGRWLTDKRVIFKGFEELTRKIRKKHKGDRIDVYETGQQITANDLTIKSLQQEISSRENLILDKYEEIRKLENQQALMIGSLLEKESAFRDAVEHANKGCTLKNTLNALSNIVTLAAGIASGIGAIGSAASVISGTAGLINDFERKITTYQPGVNINKWSKMFKEGGGKSLVSQVNVVKQDLGDFNSSIGVIKATFTEKEEKEYQNLVAFSYDANESAASQKQQFLSEIDTFLNEFSEAQDYKSEVFAFIDFSDALNKKRCEYSAAFLAINNLLNQIEQLKNDNVKLVQTSAEIEANQVGDEFRLTMEDSYRKMIYLLLKQVYRNHRMVDYLTLTPRLDFRIDFLRLGVDGIYSDNLFSNDSVLEQYKASSTNKDPGNTFLPIVISKTDYPIGFEEFIKGNPNRGDRIHTISFRVSPYRNVYLGKDSADYSEISLISARVILPNLKTNSGRVSMKLFHHGDSLFFKSNRTPVLFTHDSVIKTLVYDVNDPSNYLSDFSKLSEDDANSANNKLFASVSPFAQWTLQISTGSVNGTPMNDGLNLEAVEEIQIHFEFLHRTFKRE